MSNIEHGIEKQPSRLSKMGKGMKETLSHTKNVVVMTLALLATEPAKSEVVDGNVPVNTAVSGFWYAPEGLVGGDMHSNRSINFSFTSFSHHIDPDQTRNVMFFNTFTPSADTSYGTPVAGAEGFSPNFTGQCDAITAKNAGCGWIDDSDGNPDGNPVGKYTISFSASGLKDCDPEAFRDKNLPRGCSVDSIGDFQIQFHNCDVMTVRENIVDVNTGDIATLEYNSVPLVSDKKGCETMANAEVPETIDINSELSIGSLISLPNGHAIEVSSFEPDAFDDSGNILPAEEHPLLRDHWKLNILSGSVKIDGVPLPVGKGIDCDVLDFQLPYFWRIEFRALSDITQYIQPGQTLTMETFYVREGADDQSRPTRTENRTITVVWDN
jgi:hypothetical protein